MAALTESKLKAWEDGMVLLIPPPPRWLMATFLASFGITLPVLLVVDAMTLDKFPRLWALVQEGRRSWGELLASILGYIPLLVMTFGFAYGFLKTLAMLRRVPRRLELSGNRFIYTEPNVRGTRRREWPAESVRAVLIKCSATPSYGGKYAFTLFAGPLHFVFSSSDRQFGDEVAAAIRAALRLPNEPTARS